MTRNSQNVHENNNCETNKLSGIEGVISKDQNRNEILVQTKAAVNPVFLVGGC